MLSVLFVEKGAELLIKRIQPCFLHGGVHFQNRPIHASLLRLNYSTKEAMFLLNFQVHFELYGQENYAFEREFMYL